jgi:hypothetical protein
MLPEKVPVAATAAPPVTRNAAITAARAKNLRRIERSLESIRVPESAYSLDLFAANLRFFD